MNSFPFKLNRTAVLLCGLAVVMWAGSVWCGVGQSAVITLVFPPGARATGLGEAFTAVANDANAIYFNPAGLGMDPLANSWKAFLDGKGPFTGIASKRKSDILSSELVWAGTTRGVLRYNGKAWVSKEIYLIEQNDNLASIARRYLNVDDAGVIQNAVWKIREENNIEMRLFSLVMDKLRASLTDSVLGKSRQSLTSVSRRIVDLPVVDRTAAKIYGILAEVTDTASADRLSDVVSLILQKKDTRLSDLVELRIPFTIAVGDSVTALAMDESDRLWVGTRSGLWRCSESKWSRVTVADGLPSNVITAIAIGKYGDLAVGTDAGLGIYKDGIWTKVTTADGLPDSAVTCVAFGKEGAIFAGSLGGLIRKKDDKITLFDTSKGLLSQRVYALLYDSRDRLWVGGENGVSILSGKSWKRFKFPGSTVHCIAEQHASSIWIGTNKGVVNYQDGSKGEALPQWKTYHSKNALTGNNVKGLATFGNDVWIATDQALNKYEWAQMQALLFWEPLLPAFKLKELWHTFGAFVFPTEDWGTLGASVNYINMGVNEWTDELGRILGKARSWEGVFGLSYGLPITQNFSFGLNMKFVNSALAPGIGAHGQGIGNTYAIDVGLLRRDAFVRNLNFGLEIQNMGPSIYYIDPEKSDPIPFTIRLGSAYTAVQSPIHELTFLLDLNREIVKNYPDAKPDPFWKAIWTDLLHDQDESLRYEVEQVNANLGVEYWYSHFLAVRSGFLFDYVGERYELTLGLGLNYGNMNFDWSYIHAPEGFMRGVLERIESSKTGASGARNGQYRASFLFRL
jgi:hypothetical protein